MTAISDVPGPDPFATGPHPRMWLASTLAVEAVVCLALLLALLSGAFSQAGPMIGAVVALVALLVAPLAAWRALMVCRREAAREPLTRSGVVGAHVAVGLAFGGGVPLALSLLVGLPLSVAMGSQGQGSGAVGVLMFAIWSGLMASLVGLVVSIPLSILGGVAALTVARRRPVPV